MDEGDRTLESLARDRGAALIAYASLLTGGDRAAAQDLVQDAIVKVFGRFRTGFPPDAAEAYVRRTILTLYIDGFRRRRLWGSVRHLAPGPTAEPPADAGTDRLDLRATLHCLSPQERAVVVLRFYEDLTLDGVAKRMGLAEGTVKRYLSNALHKLEAHLGPMATDDDASTAPVILAGPRDRTERSGR